MAQIDLSDVGRSNRLYSDLEVHKVSELISQAKQQYTRLLMMTDRQSTIQEVSDICAEIRRYEVALAPHRRLPTDVLREIFIWCTWHAQTENMVMLDRCRFRQKLPQLSVTYVCSLWRRIALCTPFLWDSLRIMVLDGQSMQCAKWWLARAKALPVTIKICQLTKISMVMLRDFLSAYHLKTLHFPLYSNGGPTLIPLLSIIYDLPLGNLEEIRVQSPDPSTPGVYDVDLGAIFKAAPHIRSARFPRSCRTKLSRGILDDLAQCQLAPHLEWLATGRIFDPHEFLQMVKQRQKYARDFRDAHMRPSLLKYLSICVDHDAYNSKEIQENRVAFETLGIKFRLSMG